jgi:5-methylcytosine-specific restriction endonuclease McrA
VKPIKCSTTTEICKTYSSYLHSNHWNNIKSIFKASKGYTGKCFICGFIPQGDRPNNIHHRSYKNIGKELNQDLVLLCGPCHSRVHDISKKKPAKSTDICFAVEFLKNKEKLSMIKKSKRPTTIKLYNPLLD